jgi:excisionase family DNA binding protein
MTKKKPEVVDLRASGKVRALDARDAWLSVPEAAQELGVTPSTARRWCAAGKLDCRKVRGSKGDEYQIAAAAVRAWLTPGEAAQPRKPREQPTHASNARTHAPEAAQAPCARCRGAHLAAKTAARRMGEAHGQVSRLMAENEWLKAQVDRLTDLLEHTARSSQHAARPWWRFWER